MTDNKPIFDPDHRARGVAAVLVASAVIGLLVLVMLLDVVARSA